MTDHIHESISYSDRKNPLLLFEKKREAEGFFPEFSGLHPLVSLVYYACVLGISMTLMHPVFLLISLAGSLSCYHVININYNIANQYQPDKNPPVKVQKGASLRLFLLCLPVMVTAAVLNPLFSHRGFTVLFYLPGGNPFTLESLIYGCAAAVMLGAVIIWFAGFSRIFTSEKWICLLGSLIPHLSLLISMTLRFVPLCIKRFRLIHETQKALMGDQVRGRFRMAAAELSMLISWMLESAAVSADSMKSRGYGLAGRTSFSIYSFRKNDGILLAAVLVSLAAVILCRTAGFMTFSFYPAFQVKISPVLLLPAGIWTLLAFMPLILHIFSVHSDKGGPQA